MLAISELNCTFLPNHSSDHGSDYGELLGSTSAIQLYRVCLCCIETQEIAIFCGEDWYSSSPGYLVLDGRLLHNRKTEFNSVGGGLLGSTPAPQRYEVRLCRINTQELAVCFRGCIRYHAGDTLLNGGLLRDGWTDSDTLGGRLLAMKQASYSCKTLPPRPLFIKLQC